MGALMALCGKFSWLSDNNGVITHSSVCVLAWISCSGVQKGEYERWHSEEMIINDLKDFINVNHFRSIFILIYVHTNCAITTFANRLWQY